MVPSFSTPDYGLWKEIPQFLQEGYFSLGISLSCAALAVYLMAELNNANVLLRVSSRMLSSMLAFLLTIVIVGHRFQPGSVVMILSLLSFFPLFSTYQLPSPLLSFTSHLLVSVASLVFPKLLWLVPVYWLIQGYFRAFSLRCLLASLLAVLLPYWFYGGIAFVTDSLDDFLTHVCMVADVQWHDYAALDLRHVVAFAFLVLLFVSGAVDFYVNQFLDKTRTRIIYNAMILYGLSIVLFTLLQPQYLETLLPLLLMSTATVFGHFFTLTHTRFSHIYCIVLLVMAAVVLAVQCVCDAHLMLRW